MPLSPRLTGDSVVDQWMEEVTYELNNVAAVAGSAADANFDEEIVPVYAVDAEGTDQSLTLGRRNFVYFATVEAGTDPELPLTDVTFTQFRGEQTRSVFIDIRVVPTNYENARGVVRNYLDNPQLLAADWAIGAAHPEDFDIDPDGFDFGYRTDNKLLFARVAEASETVDPEDQFADTTAARGYDYTWTRDAVAFSPFINWDNDMNIDRITERSYPFLFLNASDIVGDGDGRSAQFQCNIVQL